MAEHEYYEVNGRQIRVRPTESGQEIDEYGNFHRQPNHFTKGFGEGENPVEADRYILFWGKGCNWSNRASIARELTLELAVVSMIVSLILGLILALIKMKKIPVLKQLANLYISVIRGTPVLVQLYVTYFGIPMILKAINLKYGTNYNANGVAPIIYAFIALAVNESAYNAEVIRASLESVPKGQIEAANALGMTYFQALRRVILPEAIVVALPSLGNSFIGLIKGTSLAFVCAVVEMTAAGKIIAGRTYRYFEVYVSLAIIYWIITIIVEQGIKLIEKKIRIPENAPAIQTDEGALNQ